MPLKKGVGGIGEAIRSAAPWPCARRVRRGRSPLLCPLRLYLLSPSQVRDFSHGLRGPGSAADPPPTSLILPYLFRFFDVSFSTSFSISFLSHFGVTFEAPNRPKCPQAAIQDRRLKIVYLISGFGSFFVHF